MSAGKPSPRRGGAASSGHRAGAQHHEQGPSPFGGPRAPKSRGSLAWSQTRAGHPCTPCGLTPLLLAHPSQGLASTHPPTSLQALLLDSEVRKRGRRGSEQRQEGSCTAGVWGHHCLTWGVGAPAPLCPAQPWSTAALPHPAAAFFPHQALVSPSVKPPRTRFLVQVCALPGIPHRRRHDRCWPASHAQIPPLASSFPMS